MHIRAYAIAFMAPGVRLSQCVAFLLKWQQASTLPGVQISWFGYGIQPLETRGIERFSPGWTVVVALLPSSQNKSESSTTQGSILHVRKAHSDKCRPTKRSPSGFNARRDLRHRRGAPRFWRCTGHERPSRPKRLRGHSRDRQQKA